MSAIGVPPPKNGNKKALATQRNVRVKKAKKIRYLTSLGQGLEQKSRQAEK